MKIRNIKITIKNNDESLKEFAETLAKARRGEHILPVHEISFHNIESLRKVITEKRIELLHIIKQYNPNSIYELAKLVDRDLKSVNVDIQTLKELDLISLEKSESERKRTKPKVEFNKINVEITI